MRRLSLFLVLILSFAASAVTSANAQMPKAVVLVKGTVTSTTGDKLPETQVAIYNGTEKVFSTKANVDGKFTAVVKPGSYTIGLTNPSYFYKEDHLQLSEDNKNMDVKYALAPFPVNRPIEISQQVFAPKSTSILSGAQAELDNIINTVKHNAKLNLEITVFPDAVAKGKKDNSQATLVKGRNDAISSYFQSKGISYKNIKVEQSMTVPVAGRFPAGGAEETSGKKKKGGSTSPAMVPQYIEIVAKNAS